MTNLQVIENIGPAYEEKLKAAGITNVEALLESCRTKKGRSDLAEKSDISEKLILTWANHADLFRINGVRGQFAELLEAAGVDTVPELARRNAENLHKAMEEINVASNLTRRLPSVDQVSDWIEEAKTLPRMLEY